MERSKSIRRSIYATVVSYYFIATQTRITFEIYFLGEKNVSTIWKKTRESHQDAQFKVSNSGVVG